MPRATRHHASIAIALVIVCAGPPGCRRIRSPAQSPPAAARVFLAVGPADLVHGPNAAGRIGDFVLENQFVRAIIDDVRGGGGFSMSGGQLLDLSLREHGSEEIGQVFTFLGRFPRQLRYTGSRTEIQRDGTASVVVTGNDPRTPGLDGETRYALGPLDHAITLTTTLTNHSTVATEVGLGDAIQWAGAEHWAPGRGFALRGESQEPFLAGIGVGATYAYAGPQTLTGPNGGNWSNPVQSRTTLVPGASVTYVRRLAVAGAGDVTGAALATGYIQFPARLRVRAIDAEGRAVQGVRVVLSTPGQPSAPLGMGSTDAHGDAIVGLERTGRFAIEVLARGRRVRDPASIANPIDVQPGAVSELRISMTEQSAIHVRVDEVAPGVASAIAVAARVLVYGVNGTADPQFGPPGRGDGARNSFLTSAHVGQPDTALAPGSYRIVATRGPERTLAEQTLTIAAGERRDVSLHIERVIDTTGYLCGDFHTHQAPSLDSPVSLRDRVRACAAEGLEVVASTDHNVATDLAPAAHDEGLDGELLTLGGDEISTDVALHPSGHWNLFPLEVRPREPLGGAPDLFELDPAALVRRAREIAPNAIVQVNHPRSGAPTGALDVVGYDRETGHGTTGAIEPTFDAIEVWNGRFQTQAENVMLDWLSMLRRGARITATANSDSHSIVVQEVGYPRTCFRMASDAVSAATPAEVVRSLRETRDVILTDGPFVRVTTSDGVSAIGRTLRAPGMRPIELHVRVESPAWAAADSLEIVHADGHFETLTVHWRNQGDVVRGEADVRVDPREGFVLFRARGGRRIAVLTDDPPMLPLAITNPVYFDVPREIEYTTVTRVENSPRAR